MSSASELEQIRIDKIQKIMDLGVDPWGGRFL